MSANLGTKRQCPKCTAKFYDLGATGTIHCPKCKHNWQDGDKKAKPKAKASKLPPVPAVKKPIKKTSDELPDDLPEVEDGGEVAELEPMEDDSVEMVSLEEVEEHEEEKEVDPDGDDADDEMFTSLSGDDKLVDDLEQYIETDEDEDDSEEE